MAVDPAGTISSENASPRGRGFRWHLAPCRILVLRPFGVTDSRARLTCASCGPAIPRPLLAAELFAKCGAFSGGIFHRERGDENAVGVDIQIKRGLNGDECSHRRIMPCEAGSRNCWRKCLRQVCPRFFLSRRARQRGFCNGYQLPRLLTLNKSALFGWHLSLRRKEATMEMVSQFSFIFVQPDALRRLQTLCYFLCSLT